MEQTLHEEESNVMYTGESTENDVKITSGVHCPYMHQLIRNQTSGVPLKQSTFKKQGYDQPEYAKQTTIQFAPSQNYGTVAKNLPDSEDISYEDIQQLSAETLQCIMVNLEEELNQLQVTAEPYQKLQSLSENETISRIDLQKSVENLTFGLQNEALGQVDLLQQMQSNFQASRNRLDDIIIEELKLEEAIDNMTQQVANLKLQNLQLRSRKLKKDDKYVLLENARHRVQESENFRRNFEVQIQQAEIQWEACGNEARNKVHAIQQDIQKIQRRIDHQQEGYKALLNNNKEVREKTQQFRKMLKGEKALKNRIEDVQRKRGEYGECRFKLQQEIIPLSNEISNSIENYQMSMRALLDQKPQVFDVYFESKQDLLRLQKAYQEILPDHFLQTVQVIMMEERCCLREDLFQCAEDLKIFNSYLQASKKRFQPQFMQMLDYLQSSTQANFNDTKTTDALVDKIDDVEYKILNVKQLIDSVRSRNPLHVPAREDPIDRALSEYIRNKNLQLQVPFIKEEFGVYRFGTRKVFLKLDHGEIKSNPQSVRTGGGYCHIDEFLDLYTQEELVQQEQKVRDSPYHKQILQRFQDNPHSSQMSPTRANRILADEKTLKTYSRVISRQTTRAVSPNKVTPIRAGRKKGAAKK